MGSAFYYFRWAFCGIVFAVIDTAAQFDVSAAPLANNEPATVSGDYILDSSGRSCVRKDEKVLIR
jgi:hypothetical protein